MMQLLTRVSWYDNCLRKTVLGFNCILQLLIIIIIRHAPYFQHLYTLKSLKSTKFRTKLIIVLFIIMVAKECYIFNGLILNV